MTNEHIRLPHDAISSAVVSIDNAIRHTLNSRAFHVSDKNVIANTNSRTLLLTTPNTTARVYLSFKIATNVLIRYFLYENPTISNVGTDVTAYNRDRNSSAAPALTVKHTPTVSNVGTELTGGYLVSNNINSERIEDRLWVLKQNEEYLIRATNNSGGNANIAILVDWYEE